MQDRFMNAWLLQGFGLDNLTLGRVLIPQPKPNEILIKVGAVSLNFRDKAIIDGIYEPHKVPNPLIPISDASGTIVSVGESVTKFKVGDRVISHLYSHWIEGSPAPNEPDFCLGSPFQGGLAEYMILEAESAAQAPISLTDEEASTLPIAALTAWFALVTYGNLKAGETVVIQGTGGVSIFGLQLAHALGAKVIVTTSNNTKGQLAKDLGADYVINYTQTPDWVSEVLKITKGVGADHLLEVVGGDGLNDSIEATKVTGKIYVIGFLGGQTTNFNLMKVIFKQTSIQGIAVGHLKALEEMSQAFDTLNIKPVIEKVYPFDKAIDAYKHLAKGAFGKIVIKIG